ncbi:MAG: FecR domain-containing protein [Deltaproteobacteria bacterium]|nr:FecR domain-containing protein [Deltaproteobacteria bacterium]
MTNLFSFVGPRQIAVLLIFLAATFVQAASDSVLTVKVRPGDTISYLALKHLHTYDQDTLNQIKKLNPHIKDLNRIKVGEAVRLPKPAVEKEQPTAPAPSPVPKEMTAAASRAVVTLVEGEVQMMAGEEQSWRPLSANAILKGGDKVRVLDNGRLEMVLDNRSVLRLAANSTLELKEVERKPEKETYRFALSLGKMWTRVTRLLGFGSKYQVDTPTAITAVQGTVYDLQVDSDQQTRVRVHSGNVLVYNPFAGDLAPGEKVPKLQEPTRVPGPTRISREAWEQLLLQQYQQVTLGREGRSTISAFDLDKARKEAWVRWNEARDKDFYGEI